MKIKTKDEIVRKVLRKMDERSLVGQKKYGATMMQEIEGQEKDLNRFLVDVQEELMLKHYAHEDERMKVITQNGNSGLHYDNLGDLDVNYELIGHRDKR